MRMPLLAILALTSLWASAAAASVSNIPEFVDPDHFAITLAPDLVMTDSQNDNAGVGIDTKFTLGLTDLIDTQAIVGFGEGPRRFRIGGNLGFDFFPDVDKQPGIGVAAQFLYVVLPNTSRVEMTAIPYIHKGFPQADGKVIDPFFAFPFGLDFSSGNYELIETAVVGANYKESEHFSFSGEFGINVDHAATYISLGIIYTD